MDFLFIGSIGGGSGAYRGRLGNGHGLRIITGVIVGNHGGGVRLRIFAVSIFIVVQVFVHYVLSGLTDCPGWHIELHGGATRRGVVLGDFHYHWFIGNSRYRSSVVIRNVH